MTGKIKIVNEDRGFGFIKADDGNEYFFHMSALHCTMGELYKGISVTFDVEQNKKGPRAVNVNIS